MRLRVPKLLAVAAITLITYASSSPAHGDAETRFVRVYGPAETQILDFESSGHISWSNEVLNVTCSVHTASALHTSNAWNRYTAIIATSEVSRLHLFDFRPPTGMVYVPGHLNTGNDPESGPYHISTEAFYMDIGPVTKQTWDDVRNWATTNGFVDLPVGSGKDPTHPVHSVNWYDAMKWCNARSEKEGLPACYRVNGIIYRTGETNTVICDLALQGYRLPTWIEHTYAGRGGLSGARFPWGPVINHNHANYRANGSTFEYDTSPYSEDTYHPAFAVGGKPYTSPVGLFPPNQFGLFDMCGNVKEWCWPLFNQWARTRGGDWSHDAFSAKLSTTTLAEPTSRYWYIGFRTVLPVPDQ